MRLKLKFLVVATLALSVALTGSHAASVCEVVLEADPADGITLLPGGKRIYCTGDPVSFTTGSNFIPDNNDNSTWQLTGPFGSADVRFDDIREFPLTFTSLNGASDVIFTNITIRNLDFSDRAAFGLNSCSNCTVQHVHIEGMRGNQYQTIFVIEGASTVTIESAVFTGLGLPPANGGFSNTNKVLLVQDSVVVLQNAVFRNMSLNLYPTVMVSADPFTPTSSSKLTVRNTTWRGLTRSPIDGNSMADFKPGRIAALEGPGAELELGEGVVIADIDLAGADPGAGKPAETLFSFDTAGATLTISPSAQLDPAAISAGAVVALPVADGDTIDSSSALLPYLALGATITANGITLSFSDVALPAGLQLHGTGATLSLSNVTMGKLTLDTPGLSPLSLRNLTLAGLELPTFNNAVVDLTEVRVTSQQQQRRALVTAVNASRVALTDVTVAGVSVAAADIQVDRNTAVLVSADSGASVTVTRLTVSGVDWLPAVDPNYYQETQLFRSGGNGTSLAVVDSSISGVRSCGTVFSAFDGGALRLERVNISDVDSSAAVEKRAVVRVEGSGSSLTATDTALRRINGSISTNGIALNVVEPGAVTLSGFTLDSVYGPNSPAIQLLLKNGTAPIALTRLNIRSVTAASAMKVSEPGSQITLQDSVFEDCVSSGGGTFTLMGCNSDNSTMQLQLLNVTFSRNKGGNEGGGVQSGLCHVLVRDSIFTRNTAANQGAAISLRLGGSLTLENTAFVSNSLTSTTGGTNGGAVYAEYCAVAVTGSTFTRNAAMGVGGGGGGLYMRASRASITRSTFFGNVASAQGGGVMALQTWLKLNDSVVAGNVAPQGGGVLMFDALPMDRLMQYTAPASAASPPPPPSLPPPPPSPPPSPAANLTSSGIAQTTLTDSFFGEIVNTTFSQNSCSGGPQVGGGGLYVREQLQRWNVLVYQCTFVSNSCPRGGAMASFYMQRTYVIRSDFRLNRATVQGGALAVTSNVDYGSYLLVQENNFVNNTAKGTGGAVNSGTAMAEVAYNTFTGNGDSTLNMYGGAFYSEYCKLLPGLLPTTANLDFRFNTWDSNLAYSGGAVAFRLCNVTMYQETFINNFASGEGGAVEALNALQTPLTVTQLNEVNMRNNSARQLGGAIAVVGTGLTVMHSNFEGNSASISGGAISTMDASPNALKVLQRKTVPFYTPEEEYFLRVYMANSTFTRNTAEQGGGAVYTDTCALVMEDMRFDGNVAGDGFPNDDWSDSGGAMVVVTAWSNVLIANSNFTNNRAFGGPAGALFLAGSTAIIQGCAFRNSFASTSGGAIAAADRLRNDSNADSTPNLVLKDCVFTDNVAKRQNGGALLTQGMNATTFATSFQRNVAGGNGGAVAYMNNLDAGFMGVTFEANAADQYGGAAYVINTPVVSVLTSYFYSNRANRTGGALSMISCNCTLTAQSTFDGNWVGGRGGAIHLQPVDNDDGNTNALAESANCVGHFLTTIQRMLTPEGLALLGTVDTRVESYNATIVYDGASLQYMTIGQFGRGGWRLPTPVVSGPAQLTGVGFDAQVSLAAGSSVKLAPGSAFAFADWDRFTVQMDGSSTRLVYLDGAITLPLSPGEVVNLAPGSALTVLNDAMALLPSNTTMSLSHGAAWRLDNGTLLGVDNTTAAISVVPGTRTRIAFSEREQLAVADWNRYVLWTSSAGAYLYDATAGSARRLIFGTEVVVAKGSPLVRHSAADTKLTAPLGITTVADPAVGEAWGLSNGTTLAIGNSSIAASALLANGSTMQIRRGSTITPPAWAGYTLALSSDTPATLLKLPSILDGGDVSSALLMGSVVGLAPGSALSRLTSSMALLPPGTMIRPDGGAWLLNNGSTLAATGGTVAALVVLPAGTSVALSDADVFTVGPSEWNRYSLWTGVMGTLLHNTSSGEVVVLSDSAVVSLARAAPLTWHSDKAVVGRKAATVTIGAGTWTLGGSLNGSLVLGGSVVASSAVLSKDSKVVMPNGTTISSADWYRYLVWMAADGTYLFDSLALTSSKLPDGTVVTLTGNSVIFPHDSSTTVAPAGGQTLTVQPGAWQLSGAGSVSPSGDIKSVAVVPAEGSLLAVGGPAGSSGTLPLIPRVGSSLMWLSKGGSQLLDTALGVSYRLAIGSSIQLASGSLLLKHDSATSIGAAAVNVTLQQAGSKPAWSFTDGRTLSVGSGTITLALAPAPLSSVQLNSPTTLPITVSKMNSIWAGRHGTLLYNHQLEGSYTVADGSEFSIAVNSTLSAHDGKRRVFTTWDAPDILTARGREWVLANGTRIPVGDGWNDVDDTAWVTHVPGINTLPDEISRSCAADFTNTVYQKDGFAYDYAALRDLISPWLKPTFETNVAPQVAAAATGLSLVDTAGFNATLLVPGYQTPTFDNAGRPISAQVTCTATRAPPDSSRARGLSTLVVGVTASSNVADLKGGAMVVDGGHGRVLFDGLVVYNNSVLRGDGGALALYQDDDQMNMQLEVFITSSNFSHNAALSGTGGALSLIADNMHQQVSVVNTTVDGNRAAMGGGISLSHNISAVFNASLISNNRGNASAIQAGASANVANDRNIGSGGGIMASRCNEVLLTHGTRVVNNVASARGGGVSVVSCALATVNSTLLQGNRAQSAGGVYLYNSLPVMGTYKVEDPVGAMIAIVAKSNFTDNVAVPAPDSVLLSEGFGGGIYARSHVSTLLADSYFKGNNASLQGGSIFIESTCDLKDSSWFLERNKTDVTAFTSASVSFANTVQALQVVRPKGCWGTVVYLPQFYNNEALLSGGALFSSHPEALSLSCNDANATHTSSNQPIDYANFSESYLAGRVAETMKMASFQVLDNKVVTTCYRQELESLAVNTTDITGNTLSTLVVNDNRAKGYGYLIAIVPSKLRIINVNWTGNTSNMVSADSSSAINNVWPGAGGSLDGLLGTASTDAGVMALDGGGGSSSSGRSSSLTAGTLAEGPFFRSWPDTVFDNDTQTDRRIVNYHITTLSNKPLDLSILLLDALDQVASENTTLRQAQVRARYLNSSNGCFAELLGGIEGVARNGTAVMSAMRLRALKGDNYTIQFKVEDSIFSGTVEPLAINISVPACSIGEVPRDNGFLCQKCDPRSFSLWQDTEPLVNCTYPNLSDITCQPCPDGAECPGGAVVVPMSGYWQSAANSTFMNACPNPEACRDGDDDMQDMLITCQEWWYSRPADFNYTAYIELVMSSTSASSSAFDGYSALTLSGEYFNASNPDDLCVLWGLPYDHPAAYARKQCATGYSGNLCAVCISVDGRHYTGKGDFSCNECFSRSISILVAVAGFLANVVTVLVTVVLTFMADYTEDEDMAIGDLVKVLIVHIQFFCIVTRLNINWPASVSGFTGFLSALTGAVAEVYSPSCLLEPDATPSEMARIDQLAAIITPLVVVVVVAVAWMVRYGLFNFRKLAGGQAGKKPTKDMRTIEEYKQDRAMRVAQRRLAQMHLCEEEAMGTYGEEEFDGAIEEGGSHQEGEDGLDLHAGDTGGQRPSQMVREMRRRMMAEHQVEREAEREAAAAGKGAAAHSVKAGRDDDGQLLEESSQEEGSRKPLVAGREPSEVVEAATVGLVMDDESDGEAKRGANGGTVPPPPPAPRPPPMAPPPPPAPQQAVLQDSPPNSEGDAQPNTPGAVDGIAAAAAASVAMSDPGLPQPPAQVLSPLPPSAAAAAGGVVIPARRPSVGGMKTGASIKTGRSRVSFDDQALGGGTPRSESNTPSRMALAAAGASTESAGLVPPPPVSTQRTSFRAAAAAGLALGGIHNATYNSDSGFSTPTGRDKCPPLLPTIPSLGRGKAEAAAAAASGSTDSVVTEGAADAGDIETGNGRHGASCRALPGVPKPAAGPSRLNAHARNAGAGGSARLPAPGPDSSASGDPLVPGSERGSFGAKGGGSFGSKPAVLTERRTSSMLAMKRRLTASTVWVRNFFKYDEEGVEEGEIRWASLANIDRTMIWWRQVLLVVMIACFILYPAWAQATLMIFACYYLDDGSGAYPDYQLAQWSKGYWLLNMNQECYSGEHAALWIPIGVVCIIVICLGIPFLTFMVTFTHRTTLHTVHVVQTYGFLYRRYNYDRYYWWEAVMQLQTLLLVIVDVFGRVLVVYQQAVLLMIVLMLIMWSNMFYQPLKHEILDQMSSMSLAVLSFTVALGLFFVPPTDRKDPVTPVASAAIGGLILAMNIALVIYFIYVMVTHGREAITRGVTRAREHMLMATSKVHMGLTVVRERVSNGAHKLRAITSRSLTTVQSKMRHVSVRRRSGSGSGSGHLPGTPTGK
ncbi:hypothetical protein HYH02_004541 [Chlamydomonas schloesseri]|uniref:Right handed beta helix domain-containing protein n=1 Tax=Chlamydomonas schloesseri TaxID=2026947 RepID=A0A835WMU2_9CHLO|nr:hypothetical protein HYH02_004541 [Chlamydomonas schloesseri]|eukprot:KAG2450703.1 hypothetical protein HYH02_004541 [Chlamydomonas schloesseri]